MEKDRVLPDLCPICGSKMTDMSSLDLPHLSCPECGSKNVGNCIDAGVFEKRGCELVVKRGVEFVTVVDCVCEDCGFSWSVPCLVKGGVVTVVDSVGAKRRSR